MSELFSFVVDKSGVRLDRYIAEELSEVSRTRVQELIREGRVKVNGRPAKPGIRLDAGDQVKVFVPLLHDTLLPENIPVDIIYQDEDLLVVDKPAGLAVHPAPGHPDHTLVNALLLHILNLLKQESIRPGIVHRLDKDASGVMVLAKNSDAQLNLIGQFKARSVVKKYLVLVMGLLNPDNGVIEAPIGRDARNRKKMAIVADGDGKDARTHYHVIRHLKNYTLLEIRPETGRTHQIRVHLSAIGYPVAGDRVYGIKSDPLPRLFLHACCLSFRLPSSGRLVEFTSPLPTDLERVLEDIG